MFNANPRYTVWFDPDDDQELNFVAIEEARFSDLDRLDEKLAVARRWLQKSSKGPGTLFVRDGQTGDVIHDELFPGYLSPADEQDAVLRNFRVWFVPDDGEPVEFPEEHHGSRALRGSRLERTRGRLDAMKAGRGTIEIYDEREHRKLDHSEPYGADGG